MRRPAWQACRSSSCWSSESAELSTSKVRISPTILPRSLIALYNRGRPADLSDVMSSSSVGIMKNDTREEATTMALHNDPSGDRAAQQCRDRLSELPDDVLLLVLDRLRGDVRQVARTCVLSKRWRTLPLMLPCLVMSASSFLPASPAGSRLPIRCLHQGTSKFTDALRLFMAIPAGGKRHIKRLTLGFSLTKQHHGLHEIGRLVSVAIWSVPPHAHAGQHFRIKYLKMKLLFAKSNKLYICLAS